MLGLKRALLVLALAAPVGCASETLSTVQASAWPTVAGGVGALAGGPIGAAVGAGIGAIIGCGGEIHEAKKDLEHEQESKQGPTPWGVTLTKWVVVALVVAWFATLVAVNYMPWLPAILRGRRERRREQGQ